MKRMGRTYEREIRLAGFVLMLVLLGANVTLFWLSTRLSRRIQSDRSGRLALVAELVNRHWQDRAATEQGQWAELCDRWDLLSIGIVGPDGIWLAHSRPELSGRPAEIPGGLNPKRIREMEERGGVPSEIYRRDGRAIQSFYLPVKRGAALVVIEQDATAIVAIDRAIFLQTVFVILGSLGAMLLFVWYLRLVLAPFRQMASQTKAALDEGERKSYGSDVDFVLDIYQRVLQDLKNQGRSLKDLYDLSRMRAERSERINKHLLESLDKGVAFVDGEGRVLSANRAALAMSGAKDAEALGELLKPAEAHGGSLPEQWTVEIAQGRKLLQVIRSRMEQGDDTQSWTMLLINDATAQRRMDDQFALLENTRLLRASAEGLLKKIGPEMERMREMLEDTGSPALEPLNRARQAIEDLGKHLQFDSGQIETAEDEGLLLQPGLGQVVELIRKVAATDSTVLISGESGTGKELAARYLHRLSARRDGPFVSINCGALPENLIESELFGYVKGAFTGAYRDKPGLMTAANGGTFLLDEVGELPISLQVRLLRVLQEREVVPVGGVKPRSIDIRVVAATNRDLEAMVREGRFRQDLYFRLNIFPIAIPPLRERISDIGLLADHLIARIAARSGLRARSLDPDALAMLQNYHWPGNVRELENVLERALVVSSGTKIRIEDIFLPESRPVTDENQAYKAENLWDVSKRATSEAERQAIAAALKDAKGNKSEAARRLHISYRVILKKIKDYGLEKPSE